MSAIRRILVPIDFSDASRAAFDYAIDFARSHEAQVDVLHVWEVPTFLPPGLGMPGVPGGSLADFVRTEAEKSLERFFAEAAKRGAKVHDSFLEPGHPANDIVRKAAEGGYDLVVIGTHGRTGLSRAIIGSVAERVVRHATCPVLTVRAPKANTATP